MENPEPATQTTARVSPPQYRITLTLRNGKRFRKALSAGFGTLVSHLRDLGPLAKIERGNRWGSGIRVLAAAGCG